MSSSKTELPDNILVVDDNLDNLRLLTKFLSKRGYEVRPIRDGLMVLPAVEAKQPDLILLDIMMPSINGYQVCSQLKADEKYSHIPVIFLSALHEAEDKVRAFSTGGVDYITKPFQSEEVIARIENQLHICRLQKQLKEQNEQLQEEIRERQLMEEKLHSSQAEIRGFFEAMADIAIVVNVEDKALKIAPTNPDKLYPAGTDIIGQTVEKFFNKQSDLFSKPINQALSTQQVVNFEYSLKAGKEEVWFSASIAPTSENTVAWVARDISDRKRAEDQLRLLLETTQAISQSPDVDSAIANILYLICQAIDWDFAEAWLPSENGDVLTLSWGWYGRDPSLEEFRRYSENLTCDFSEGLPGRVWASGATEWIEDVSAVEDSIFTRAKIAAKLGIKAGFAIPIVADNKVLVVLGFFKRGSLAKNQQLLDLVGAIAAMISSLMLRKQTEEALRISEERWQFAIESSGDGIWDWDAQTNRVFFSKRWKEMLGYEDLDIGSDLSEWETRVHPDDKVPMYADLEQHFRGETPCYANEYRMLCKNGTYKWILDRGKVVCRNGDGKPLRVIGTHTDISDRKAAEKALRESEERFRNLFENSPVAYQSLDEQGCFIDVNDELCELLGYTREELIGKSFGEVWLPEMQPYFPKKFSCFKADGIVCGELPLVTKNAIPVTVLIEGRIQHDLEGRFVKMHCILYNISDRKRAEEALQASRARLEKLTASVPGAIYEYVLSPDGSSRFEYMSSGIRNLQELEPEQALKNSNFYLSQIHPEDFPGYCEAIAASAANLEPFSYEWRNQCPSGKLKWLEAKSRPECRSNGEIIWYGVVFDITERKQAEEALQKAVLAADTANRAKSEFLASMSHELRTPLNAILGFSQIMSKDTFISEENQKNLVIINRAGEHLLALINDILEVSKIEAGQITFNENCFDLRQLLNSLQQMLQLKATSQGLHLIFECGTGLPQYVKTDEGKLRQVLLNILGNALKFTPTGSVTLRASVGCPIPGKTTTENSKKQTLHFEIEDTGSGIIDEEIHLLFEAFGQTETGRKSQQGTGLGLPISQKYVQLMGGDITVSSTPGRGSLFAFDIQVDLAEAERVQTAKVYRTVSRLAPDRPECRILIVDDIAESRLLLLKILASIGFSVREAENGQQAVQTWKEWQPHLILMDMRMPVMDGYEATRQIRAEEQNNSNFQERNADSEGSLAASTAKTIIFALTASAFEEERKIILSSGCDYAIGKPFQVEVLLEKIGEYLKVEYEWEAENIDAENRQKTSDQWVEDDWIELLSQMPAEWIAQLYDAAPQCDEEVILELVEKIPAENAVLASALRDLANNFQFEQIQTLARKSSQ